MRSASPQNQLQLFTLPDWARWSAWVTLSQDLKIQIASLKYPRWDMSFYPVFFDMKNKLLFPFPKTLEQATQDGRLWQCCPQMLWSAADGSAIVFDDYDEGDHPRPPHSARLRISPPDFLCTVIEGKTGDYEKDGGVIPRLSKLADGFQGHQVELLPGTGDGVFAATPLTAPPWPIEKRK